jgi:predicted dehydrogenase
MTKNLRAAVVGLGRMGAQPSSRFEGKIPEGWFPLTHAEAFRATEGVELVALCDTNEERLTQFREIYGIDNAYTDYRKMIEEVKPDLISVATRTNVRGEIITFAAEHGVRGFYAEKALSRSVQECKDVLNTIEKHGAKVVYGATRRAMDIYKRAKEICWSGELGDVQQVQIEFGRGAMLWSHSHSVDLITYFANSIDFTHVQGHCEIEEGAIKSPTFIDHDPIVDHAYFKFSNGVSGIITQTAGLNIRIGCSQGILTINGDGFSIQMNRRKDIDYYFHGFEEIFVRPAASGTQHLMNDLRDAVNLNQPVKHVTPEELLAGHKMMMGVVQSTLLGGKMITPGEIPADLLISGRTGTFYA